MNNIIDEPTLKQVILYLGANSLELKMVDPNNDHERKELKELDKKGLIKFRVIDASAGFIAHKDILPKIVNDLSSKKVFSQIVDRNINSPGMIQISASNVWLRKTTLTPEQFEKKVHEENLMLENYKNATFK